MATLLAVARAINLKAKEYPKESAQYFSVAYNAVLDMCPEAAVWMWQIVKFESRFEQHKEDCVVCEHDKVDCPVATKLKSKLMVYRARLSEAETWTKTQP